MQVSIGGRDHVVVMPKDFATREELVHAWATEQNRLRACYAALGLCLPSLKVKASYKASRFDVLAYGGEVRGELRDVSPTDAVDAASVIFGELVQDLFPRETEAQEMADFSEASAAQQTSQP